MPASWLDVDPATGEASRADALIVAAWPEPDALAQYVDEDAERSFELLRTVVTAARSTRARYRLSPREELDLVVRVERCRRRRA